MTRKSYAELQEELREAQRYIWELIHDDTYAVVNGKAYPHEYARIRSQIKFMALIMLPFEINANHTKRALHVRHPGVLLIAQPTQNLVFVCLLAHDPESWCVRVKATMNKYDQPCTLAWTPSTGNPSQDYLTCLELAKLSEDPNIIEEVLP